MFHFFFSFYVFIGVFRLPVDRPWDSYDIGVALVGDAAHLMPPYAG